MRKTSALAALGLTAATLGVVTTTATAAGDDDRSASGDRPSAIEALTDHPRQARDTGGQAFRVTDRITDPDGTTHVRMERTYHGLPVVGGDLVVHQDSTGDLEAVSQTLAQRITVHTSPQVKAKAAQRKAMHSKVARTIDKLKARGKRTLVVDATGDQPRLAWKVLTGGVQKDGTPSRLATYVDAVTGTVLRSEQEIQTVDGEGESLYSGTVPLQLTQEGSSYQMKDPTRGGTYTIDVQNGEDVPVLCQLLGIGCATGPLVEGPDTSFGDGTNQDRDSAAVDAQYGTNMTWDYYQQVHGRDGIFGDGSGSYNRVHYGNGYVNAFWDGEKMTYGDGDGQSYGPLVSLDVAGHEMSHGVTEHTAGLTYSGESGGLNEATSDIFGSMVEFYADNSEDPGDYYIGEEFDLAAHEGLRRMDHPSTDGSSQDCWSTETDSVDVHYSSGVGNHFFYLLAEGSGAKTIGGKEHDSPTCDGSTITGIGREKAADIWFRALTVYMTSDTDYAGAREATLSAAADLYGEGSTEYDTVAAAWTAVNVG